MFRVVGAVVAVAAMSMLSSPPPGACQRCGAEDWHEAADRVSEWGYSRSCGRCGAGQWLHVCRGGGRWVDDGCGAEDR